MLYTVIQTISIQRNAQYLKLFAVVFTIIMAAINLQAQERGVRYERKYKFDSAYLSKTQEPVEQLFQKLNSKILKNGSLQNFADSNFGQIVLPLSSEELASGHLGITDVFFSPDNATFIFNKYEGSNGYYSYFLIDYATGHLIDIFRNVRQVKYSSNGEWLIILFHNSWAVYSLKSYDLVFKKEHKQVYDRSYNEDIINLNNDLVIVKIYASEDEVDNSLNKSLIGYLFSFSQGKIVYIFENMYSFINAQVSFDGKMLGYTSINIDNRKDIYSKEYYVKNAVILNLQQSKVAVRLKNGVFKAWASHSMECLIVTAQGVFTYNLVKRSKRYIENKFYDVEYAYGFHDSFIFCSPHSSRDSKVRIYNRRTGLIVKEIPGTGFRIYPANTAYFIISRENNGPVLYQMKNFSEVLSMKDRENLGITPSGKYLLMENSNGKTIIDLKSSVRLFSNEQFYIFNEISGEIISILQNKVLEFKSITNKYRRFYYANYEGWMCFDSRNFYDCSESFKDQIYFVGKTNTPNRGLERGDPAWPIAHRDTRYFSQNIWSGESKANLDENNAVKVRIFNRDGYDMVSATLQETENIQFVFNLKGDRNYVHPEVAAKWMKSKLINRDMFLKIGPEYKYEGVKFPSRKFEIPKITLGSYVLENVQFTMNMSAAHPYLGMSSFKSLSIKSYISDSDLILIPKKFPEREELIINGKQIPTGHVINRFYTPFGAARVKQITSDHVEYSDGTKLGHSGWTYNGGRFNFIMEESQSVDVPKVSFVVNSKTQRVNLDNYSAKPLKIIKASILYQYDIWDETSAELLFSYFADYFGGYLAITPDGYYTKSKNFSGKVAIMIQDTLYEISQLNDNFYNPNVINSLLLNQSVDNRHKYNLQRGLAAPPKVELLTTDTIKTRGQGFEITPQEEQFNLNIRISSRGGGILGYRMFNNSKLLHDVTVSEGSNTDTLNASLSVSPVTGNNQIKIVAYSMDNTASEPLLVKYNKTAPEDYIKKPNLYAIMVGINDYQNANYNLKYAVQDMQSFSDTITHISRTLFDSMSIVSFINKTANRNAIADAFKQMGQRAKPDDVFVFYYAGHGISSEHDGNSDFHFVLHQVTQMNDAKNCGDYGISGTEFKSFLKNIQANKQLCFIDACNSGAITKGFDVRSASKENAIAKLNRYTGCAIFASTNQYQYATELDLLGHGIFTYALLQGLSGKAAGSDCQITVSGIKLFLDNEVPRYTQQYRGTEQYPSTSLYGQDFPFGLRCR
jgi:hypothetical protein